MRGPFFTGRSNRPAPLSPAPFLVPADARGIRIEGLEADLRRYRGILEMEIARGGIHEAGIGHHGFKVMPGPAPILELHPEAIDLSSVRPPIEVPFGIDVSFPLRSAAPEQALVPQHDIAGEVEGHMRLRPRELELLIAGEGEDVVPDHVLLPVVLVIASGGRAIDEIVF
jgi:hypothetical protein